MVGTCRTHYGPEGVENQSAVARGQEASMVWGIQGYRADQQGDGVGIGSLRFKGPGLSRW